MTDARRWRRRTLILIPVLVAYSAWMFTASPFATLSSWGGGTFVFDMTSNYDEARALENLEALGPDGRATYRAALVADVGFMLLNAAVVASLMFWALTHLTRWPWLRAVIALPALSLLLDLTENSAIWSMLGRFPASPGGAADVASTVTGVKLSIVPLVFAAVLLLWLAAALVRWRAPRQETSQSR